MYRKTLARIVGVTAIAVSLVAVAAMARPAYPGWINAKQPDGSEIKIRHWGNEHFHYTITEDSLLIASDSLGYWNYADENGKSTGVRAHAKDKREKKEKEFLNGRNSKGILNTHKKNWRKHLKMPLSSSSNSPATLKAPAWGGGATWGGLGGSSSSATGIYAAVTQPKRVKSMTEGDIRGLVVLVEFSDVHFMNQDSRKLYDRFMNESGFSDYDNVGSVRDYFIQNSDSIFRPSFDVVGPIRLPNKRDSYGYSVDPNDISVGARVALSAAIDTIVKWGTVDFSQYDNDGDGVVDFVYMIYAGVSASDSDVMTAIWPHASYLSANQYGKRVGNSIYVNKYACSNEISGVAYTLNRSTTAIDGIGAMAHEFSHVLGLMDTYDIYYSDANYYTPYTWDLMDAGTYNCKQKKYYVMSCSPPFLNAFERYSLNWLKPKTLSKDDTSWELLNISRNEGLVLPSTDPNEYYFLDYHQLSGFDGALDNHGMLIWHIAYNRTAWENNELNTTSTQRVDLIEADGVGNQMTSKGDAFPGSSRVTKFSNFALWKGGNLGVTLSNITETDSSVKFDVSIGDGSLVYVSSSSEPESSSEAAVSSSAVVPASSSNKTLSSSSASPKQSSSSDVTTSTSGPQSSAGENLSSGSDAIRRVDHTQMEWVDPAHQRYFDLNGRRVPAPKLR